MQPVSLGSRRSLRALGVALVVLVLAVMVLGRADAAHAEFGLTDFNAIAKNAAGAEETRAGVHPYASTVEFGLTKIEDTVNGLTFPDENVRNVRVDLPAGFVGAPTSLPTCERIDLMSNVCPAASQVGVITPTFVLAGQQSTVTLGVYNLKPRDGEVADFGFVILGVPVHIRLSVRSGGDYGVRATLTDIPESAPFIRSKLTLWGVPADPVHTAQRGTYYLCFGDQDSPDCTDPSLASNSGGGFPAGIVPTPFLSNPTLCDKPVTTTIAIESWQTPGVWKSDSVTTATPLTGCDRLTFDPSIETEFDTTQADAPAGLDFNMAIPHATAVGGTIAPSLRKAVVTLPPGFSMNPSGAEGLTGCTDEQIGIGSVRPIACGLSSKIGDAMIDTPLLGKQLTGAVYLGQPVAGKPYRLFLAAGNDVYGLSIRVEGIITPDPVTGRVTVTFDNNPQLPFSNLHLRFKGGARAPLATPNTCGAGTTVSALTPWAAADAAPATPSAGVAVSWDGDGTACPAPPHTPSFKAGAGTPRAAAGTTFALAFGREDRQQYLKDTTVTLPKGLLAIIGSVAQCAEAPAAAGTCGEGSRIGSTTVASGAGALPLGLGGTVSLTGPYKGAPFGLSIVVPAKAGPFDLGLVVVRAAIHIDPITAVASVVADPLPQILEGIPTRIRKVNVTIDRDRFMINPTSCAPKTVDGVLGSVADQSATLSSRFQISDCSALKLKPSLALSLSGKGQTVDGKHPAISATLTQPKGQSNLKKVRVALPLSLALDTDNANGLCEFVDGSKAEPTCPKASIVGSATAVTPILDQPLSGPVYFVKNVRKDPKSGRDIRTLPKLVIPLVGQNGVKLTLTGTSTVDNDQLVTTFDNIPDAPVSSFKLNINGGKGGILAVSGADICKATQVADQEVDGQNTKNADADVVIQTPSCPLKVLSKKVGKSSVTVKVGGLGAGKVTVTGKGIKKTTKSISKSTVATITAKRTTGTPGRVKVSFIPAGAKKAKTATATLR